MVGFVGIASGFSKVAPLRKLNTPFLQGAPVKALAMMSILEFVGAAPGLKG